MVFWDEIKHTRSATERRWAGLEEKLVVTATYDRDSKRYHRYLIDDGQGVTGTVYIPKNKEQIPEEIVIKLREKIQT
jgi:hypothetical protein